MKNLINILSITLIITSLNACLTPQKTQDKQIYTPTTYILVRHAEKVLDVRNPDLTQEGEKRAEGLKYLLKDVHLDAIYSSDYKRTRQTAAPTAKAKNMEVQLYDPRNLAALITEIEEKYAGKTILVAGHSNTTPKLANLLAGTNYPDFDERIYDNFFVVEVYKKGTGKVLLLKY